MKILLAVDGSKHSLDAVKCVIEHANWYRGKPQIELVTVHRAVPPLRGMGVVVSKAQLQRYYEEEGEQCLAEAVKLLNRAGLRYQSRILVGDPAEMIARHAKARGCDLVCVGSPAAFIGSVATKILNISPVPVLLVR